MGMLWIDLETTGLDARVDVPLELALAVTDDEGNLKACREWLIYDETPTFDSVVARAKKDRIVGKMHRKSGLWDVLDSREQFDYYSIDAADNFAAEWVEEQGAKDFPLAGNSIGSLDRPFVLYHFPILNETVHYRNIDVSTLKELCKRHNFPVYDQLAKRYPKKETHRASADIMDSIREYQNYLDNFLIQAAEDIVL